MSDLGSFGRGSGNAEYDHSGYHDGYRAAGDQRGARPGGGRHSARHSSDDDGDGYQAGGRHSGGQQDDDRPGGYQDGGYQGGGGYRDGGQRGDGYERDGYPGGQQSNGHQSNGYPSAGYPSAGYSGNGYRENGYGGNGYPSGAYQDGSYQRDGYQNAVPQNGAYPDGYQNGAHQIGAQQRGGYEDSYQDGAYRNGAQRRGAYPDSHQDAPQQRGAYPDGYPDGAARPGAYQDGAQPGGRYQDGAYPHRGYQRDGYPDGGHPAGGHPAGGYPDDGYQDEGFFGGAGAEPATRAERRRGRQDRPRKRRGRLVPVLAIMLVIGLVAGIWVGGRRFLGSFGGAPADYAGAGTGAVVVQVQDGDTATDIATTLVNKGVVKSEKAFRDAAKGDARSAGIQPGFYKLHRQMSAASALTLLLDPKSRVISKITIPEGQSVAAILAKLSKATGTPLTQLQAAAKNTAALGLPDYAKGRLEGFLWPATYDFDPGTPAADMLKKMVSTYRTQVDASGLSAQASAAHITPYDMLTIASLIEAEGKATDFTKISRVVYNRLAKPQRLQFDSTVNYAMNQNAVALPTKKLNIHIDSPYNTYDVDGLPPGPISNPGENAINAALHPAQGPWLYFVVKDEQGNSYFTADFDDFVVHKQQAIAAGLF